MRRKAVAAVLLILALLLSGCQARRPSADNEEAPETGAPAAPSESGPAEEETGPQDAGPEESGGSEEKPLEDFVSEAIIDYFKPSFPRDELPAYAAEYHETIGTVEEDGTVSVYLVALYAQYQYAEGEVVLTGAVCKPMAVTFLKEKGGKYAVLEIWEAQDGSRYEASIREKFPPEMAETALERMSLGLGGAMEICEEKARAYFETQGG